MRWAHLPDVIIFLCIELAAPKVLPILALLERRCRAPTRERLAFFVPLMSIPFVIPPVIILGSFYEERFEIMHKLVTARSMSSFAIATAQGALPFLRSLRFDRVVSRGFRHTSKRWAELLSAALVHLPMLEELHIIENALCDECMELLASAIFDGACRALVDLSLSRNIIGCDGMAAFSAALSHREEWRLRRINLNCNLIGDEGLGAFAAVLKRLPALQELLLHSNHISDAGLCILSTSFWVPSGVPIVLDGHDPPPAYLEGASLTWLDLSANTVGDDGASSFAVKIGEGAAPRLQKLYLQNNQIGEAGLGALVSAFDTRAHVRSRPLMREVFLGGNNVTPDWMEENIYEVLASVGIDSEWTHHLSF